MKPEPLDPQLMLRAYARGIFPMAEKATDPELFWVDPDMRGIFPMEKLYLSRSMRRFLRGNEIKTSLNTEFETVLFHCSNRSETWINPTLKSCYKELHSLERCHSLEVWQSDELVGGIFGLTIGGAFFGESMFSLKKNGSKTAVIALRLHLQNCGFKLFDTQFITDHLKSLGAIEISKSSYRNQLAKAVNLAVSINSQPLPNVQGILQRNTQTS